MIDMHVKQALAADPREGKLPAWTQDKLKSLRGQLETVVKELVALKQGTEPYSFWLSDFDSKDRFYLPRYYGQLYFGDPAADERRFHGNLSISQVRDGSKIRPNVLAVSSEALTIKVLPHAANVVHIAAEQR